jgi:LmbE family N-acetylglucosaminyl deacetylase
MKNFKCEPSPVRLDNLCVYHSMPLSLRDQLNKPVIPDVFVDVSDKIQIKREMLNCHKSQKEWLDTTQGLDAYLDDMQMRAKAVGELSGFCEYAEGWIRHNPIGFCAEDFDPLAVIARPAAK